MAGYKLLMTDIDADRVIGSITELVEGSKGLRFDVVNNDGETLPAFVVHFDYQYFAYLNRCGHIAVQLDYMPGEFFSDDGQNLVCATHGAEYAPDTGACMGGPCYGVGLEPIKIEVRDDCAVLMDDRFTLSSKNVSQ